MCLFIGENLENTEMKAKLKSHHWFHYLDKILVIF